MKEPNSVTLSTEEMILDLVRALDEKVDGLEEGQSEIKSQLATHEERSKNQATRIERVERAGGAITIALIVALFGVFMSGCGLFSNLVPPAAPAPEGPKVDVVARAVKNTVSLQTPDGDRFCSGVASEGTIVTALHCVEDGAFEVVYKGQAFPGVVVKIVEAHDLAFVDAVGARLKDSVPFATKSPVLGNKVVWMGYPLGLDFIMGVGIVGNPSVPVPGLDQSVMWMAVYGQFIPGNSGGPVFNHKGELIGIVSMTMTYNSNYLPVGYAIPLDVLTANL